MARDPLSQAVTQAQNSKGLPPGFKLYTPFPFSGMNQQDSPIAIADQEFLWMLNFIKLGNGRLRTAWDAGTPLYTAPMELTIASFFFFTIASTAYAAVFLSDGSAVQVAVEGGAVTPIGPAGTFYNSANGQLTACAQWGVLYLLISNRNTVNDYWAWDGSLFYQAGSAAPNGVTLLSGGNNYGSVPLANPFGGAGVGLALSATIQAGSVVNVEITDPGKGYQIGDVVQVAFSGGGSDTSAQLIANLAAGGVAAVNVTDGGTGYTAATIAFTGGGGSGAAGTVQIGSGVSSVTVNAGGSGYTSGAAISFSGGAPTVAATATAVTVAGVVTEIDITDPGFGYSGTPSVVISGAGTGAMATATIQNGIVVGVTMTALGSGYTTAPAAIISGTGTGATAEAILSPASVQGVSVINGGTGFIYAPNINFVGGNGVGATGTVNLTGTSVATVNMTSGGSGYTIPPQVEFWGGGAGAIFPTGTAIMADGSVIGVNLTNAGANITNNIFVDFHSQPQDLPTTVAGAIVYLKPTSIESVTMSNYGKQYTTAPAVEVLPGANNSAYATVELMPYGVSGSSMETFQSRVWIADPAPSPTTILPPGGNWQVSAPGSFTDFATSDGGVLFTNSDGFLQTRYTDFRQSSGYLYAFGDGSVSVISSVTTSGSPSTTTFNYQNVDPQTGLGWRDARQDFGRSLILANTTGIYGLYGGSVTKVSAKLDQFFTTALFPPAAGALQPSSAIATIFNIKHYLMLMTAIDPDTNQPTNVMATWNEKEWVLTSQSVNLTYIGTQKIGSQYAAWGTDGTGLFPLFNAPSTTLTKRLDTKLYGGQDIIMLKQFMGLWMSGQDQSSNLAGIKCNFAFNVSGLAVQPTPATPNIDMEPAPSRVTDLLYVQPSFQAPPPFWPMIASGTGGAPFSSLGARMTTTSPDWVLSHLALGYTDIQGFYGG